MKSIFASCVLSAVLAFGTTAASAATSGAPSAAPIQASASGRIGTDGSFNTMFGGGIGNHVAGFITPTLQTNNWFEFAVPSGLVNSATLSIYNAAGNSSIDPNAVFTLHAPDAFTFSGLVNSPSFGQVTLVAANTGVGHYVDIALNNAGVAYVNSLAGGTVRFGGTVTTATNPGVCSLCIVSFGYTQGSPVAQLTLTAAPGGVPEPASWAMLIAGFGLVGAAARRRRTALTTA